MSLNITEYSEYRERLFAYFEANRLRIFATEIRHSPKSLRVVFSATGDKFSTEGKQALEISFPIYTDPYQASKVARAMADLWEHNQSEP